MSLVVTKSLFLFLSSLSPYASAYTPLPRLRPADAFIDPGTWQASGLGALDDVDAPERLLAMPRMVMPVAIVGPSGCQRLMMLCRTQMTGGTVTGPPS